MLLSLLLRGEDWEGRMWVVNQVVKRAWAARAAVSAEAGRESPKAQRMRGVGLMKGRRLECAAEGRG